MGICGRGANGRDRGQETKRKDTHAMNVQGDLWAIDSFVEDWRVSRADRYGVENPAQRQRARRISNGVPGTRELAELAWAIYIIFLDRLL